MHDHADIVRMLIDDYGVDVHTKEEVVLFLLHTSDVRYR